MADMLGILLQCVATAGQKLIVQKWMEQFHSYEDLKYKHMACIHFSH